jgi:ribosomal protein S18 acetylase RimI-like enzyme
VRRIARITWRATYERIHPAPFIRAVLRRGYDRQRMLVNLLDASRVAFVVECDGHVVGYADLRDGDPLGPPEVELTRIYVLPTSQGTGCGRALLDACAAAAKARGARRMVLGVDTENRRSIAWYERRGFVAIGHEDFESGGVTRPVLRMALDLGSASGP